uniref:NPL4 homolog, ubiquitin recognition factor n=1 Tax=Ovis aries TaxID=9940 RepID=A0AC11ENP8_SHEEP
MAESIIIRVQSPDGVKRITATKRETAATFLKKVAKEFGFQNNGFSVYINRNKTGEITASSNKSLNLLKINNTREDSTSGHHQMVNTKIRLIIFSAAKDGEALYSQQKQDRKLTMAQIMSSLLLNSDLN